MKEVIRSTYIRLLNECTVSTKRYLFHTFNINNQLTGIIGPRGVGKTTLMLQYIKEHFTDYTETLYFSADHIYFNTLTLLEFIQELYQNDNVKVFFIDEIHKYKNWNQELKNIYDSFPQIKIIFSGSSSMDLIKGSYDLSRRGVLYNMKGLSFREYLNFTLNENYKPVEFTELISNYSKMSIKFSEIPKLLGHFKNYLSHGYYPFFYEGLEFYYNKILSIIEKTIYEDISNFYKLKTENLHYFKKILYFLSTISPGTINMNNLGKSLGIDNKTCTHYINILKETGLAKILYSNYSGAALIRKPEKIYIENTSLYNAISNGINMEPNIGTLRELFFLNSANNIKEGVCYTKNLGDFVINNIVFEIGGKNKTNKQIKNLKEEAYLVKDDMLIGDKNSIPLYLFGFLY